MNNEIEVFKFEIGKKFKLKDQELIFKALQKSTKTKKERLASHI